jgi:hypothetical protein
MDAESLLLHVDYSIRQLREFEEMARPLAAWECFCEAVLVETVQPVTSCEARWLATPVVSKFRPVMGRPHRLARIVTKRVPLGELETFSNFGRHTSQRAGHSLITIDS